MLAQTERTQPQHSHIKRFFHTHSSDNRDTSRQSHTHKRQLHSQTHILLLMNTEDSLITLSLTLTDKTHARCAAGVCLPYLLA